MGSSVKLLRRHLYTSTNKSQWGAKVFDGENVTYFARFDFT